jgi:hypothetical protein
VRSPRNRHAQSGARLRIIAAWAEQKVVRIYKTYGADAVQVMSENPYRLARDIRGSCSKDRNRQDCTNPSNRDQASSPAKAQMCFVDEVRSAL